MTSLPHSTIFLKQNRSTEGCSKLKRSVDMTSLRMNGLHKNRFKSLMGQDQVFGGVNVLCFLAAPAANSRK